ncbi:MmgE/PrpD family protein [Photobacterium japonica]|uniref:MmgE/PrpD family protein n=1 Tax=Photobacterium japonica TaxID=2910235 RepID=UPI003D14C58E
MSTSSDTNLDSNVNQALQPFLEQLAQWCCDLQLNAIPAEALDVAQTAMIDYFAVTIPGSEMPVSKNIQAFVANRVTHGPCRILGTEQTASMAYAAYANGVASHALDFDDVSWATIGHPTVTIAPAVLAAAEQENVMGDEALLAYVTAIEGQHKIARLLMPTLSEQGWHTTPVIGIFGAVIAAAKILKVDAHTLSHALAIAASMASGVRGNFGSQTKALHAGMAAFNGINALELAQLGVTGRLDVLENADGFAACFTGLTLTSPSVAAMTEWDILTPGIVFKQYPCCSGSHPAIDCLSDAIENHGISADNIEHIAVGVSLLGPRELVCNAPTNAIEAKFSMQYALAARLHYGQVGLTQFTDTAVQDDTIQDWIRRIDMTIDPELAKLGFIGTAPAKLTITTKDGQTHCFENNLAKGNPEKPLSEQDIASKFSHCVTPMLGEAHTERLYRHLCQLSTTPISTIIK